jgi:hypothetical protein
MERGRVGRVRLRGELDESLQSRSWVKSTWGRCRVRSTLRAAIDRFMFLGLVFLGMVGNGFVCWSWNVNIYLGFGIWTG